MESTIIMKNFGKAKTLLPKIVIFNNLSMANNHKCPHNFCCEWNHYSIVLYQKKNCWAGEVAQAVEPLPSKCKALSSKPSTAKKRSEIVWKSFLSHPWVPRGFTHTRFLSSEPMILPSSCGFLVTSESTNKSIDLLKGD
jgi:hypothetical protein